MQSKVQSEDDRRFHSPKYAIWWEKLSLAQKFSVSSLAKFGYELLFIRYELERSYAVLVGDNGLAVVSDDGEINTAPSLKVR